MIVQHVVILGGGAFGCEAMRSAVWNGAGSVTMVTREKSKCGMRLHACAMAVPHHHHSLAGPVCQSQRLGHSG